MKTSQLVEVRKQGELAGMRSNHNPSTSVQRSAATKLDLTRMPQMGMPMEWLDSGSWRLPSGKALAEFALQAGFLAPLLFRAERFDRGTASESPEAGIAVSAAKGIDKESGL
jgi:hypothetical protein